MRRTRKSSRGSTVLHAAEHYGKPAFRQLKREASAPRILLLDCAQSMMDFFFESRNQQLTASSIFFRASNEPCHPGHCVASVAKRENSVREERMSRQKQRPRTVSWANINFGVFGIVFAAGRLQFHCWRRPKIEECTCYRS